MSEDLHRVNTSMIQGTVLLRPVNHVFAWSVIALSATLVLAAAYSLVAFYPEIFVQIPVKHHGTVTTKVLGDSTTFQFPPDRAPAAPPYRQPGMMPPQPGQQRDPIEQPGQPPVGETRPELAKPAPTSTPPMSLNVGPQGKAAVTGTIATINSGSLTVTSWGGNWTITIGNNTAGSSTPMNPGDTVMVNGKIDSSASWTIAAASIQNMTAKQRRAEVAGMATSTGASGFTLVISSKKTAAVTITANTVVTIDGQQKSATDMVDGMRVMVSGTWDASRTTVQANKIQARALRQTPPAGKAAPKPAAQKPQPSADQEPPEIEN